MTSQENGMGTLPVTPEMHQQLREPLPSEAVSAHPTRKYLSSIKAIYVTERLNMVFGLGSWTIKADVVERVDKTVVVKAYLEIPDYGFYGEAFGGNDNEDLGDAYKGAATDALTKIAAQQLEVGIDVFKGLAGTGAPSGGGKGTASGGSAKKDATYWCDEHQTPWFKKGKMRDYAHPITDAKGNTTGWCSMPEDLTEKEGTVAYAVMHQLVDVKNALGWSGEVACEFMEGATGVPCSCATIGEMKEYVGKLPPQGLVALESALTVEYLGGDGQA